MKFDNMQAYTMDADLEAGAGVTVQYPNGMAFTIRRAGGTNTAFQKRVQAVAKTYRHGFDGMDEDKARGLLAEIYADTVIVGWSGVKSEGRDVPFTRDAAVALLSGYPELMMSLKRDAEDPGLFQAEEEAREELEKN